MGFGTIGTSIFSGSLKAGAAVAAVASAATIADLATGGAIIPAPKPAKKRSKSKSGGSSRTSNTLSGS